MYFELKKPTMARFINNLEVELFLKQELLESSVSMNEV
jgi:hypothetical protein